MGMTPHGGHRLSSQTCWGWGCGERSYHQSFFQGLILAILIWFCVRGGASPGQESVLCSVLSSMFNIVSVSLKYRPRREMLREKQRSWSLPGVRALEACRQACRLGSVQCCGFSVHSHASSSRLFKLHLTTKGGAV